MNKLKIKHKNIGSRKVMTKLTRARGELNSVLSDKVESDILQSRQYYYDKGNNPDIGWISFAGG